MIGAAGRAISGSNRLRARSARSSADASGASDTSADPRTSRPRDDVARSSSMSSLALVAGPRTGQHQPEPRSRAGQAQGQTRLPVGEPDEVDAGWDVDGEEEAIGGRVDRCGPAVDLSPPPRLPRLAREDCARRPRRDAKLDVARPIGRHLNRAVASVREVVAAWSVRVAPEAPPTPRGEHDKAVQAWGRAGPRWREDELNPERVELVRGERADEAHMTGTEKAGDAAEQRLDSVNHGEAAEARQGRV